jgi:hypothetical protein
MVLAGDPKAFATARKPFLAVEGLPTSTQNTPQKLFAVSLTRVYVTVTACWCNALFSHQVHDLEADLALSLAPYASNHEPLLLCCASVVIDAESTLYPIYELGASSEKAVDGTRNHPMHVSRWAGIYITERSIPIVDSR